MELNVTDRLILLNVLPKEGDVVTLRILRDLQDALGFREEELDILKFKQEGSTAYWDQEAAKTLEKVDIKFGKQTRKLVRDAFDVLDKQKKLTLQMLPTYEKFEAKES
jgi:hypothetical protein